ncbi:hypothetical protein COFA105466_11415 [Corynebacterium falsenii]
MLGVQAGVEVFEFAVDLRQFRIAKLPGLFACLCLGGEVCLVGFVCSAAFG